MIKVTVKRNDIAKLADQLAPRAARVVAQTSLEIEEGAKRRSRIRTGTMMRGWRVVFDDPVHAVIGNPVPYTIYNEFGTRHVAAQPMLIPEVEIARPKFRERCAAIVKL
jgi:DNA integrity scanning protein DisA with diadenylate cyclase activity